MCQHKKDGQENNILNLDSIGHVVWQDMGGDSFDQAYKAASSPKLRNAGARITCSCDLINFVDDNKERITKVAKDLGCSTDYRTLLSLTCYIEKKSRQPFAV